MKNNVRKSLFVFIGCLLATAVWADTAVFQGNDLNVSGGAKTVGSITLSVPSSNGMTWSSSMLYASGSGKQFILTANSGSISQVLITMNGTSNRFQDSNITNCTSCTKSGSVYTCEFSTPQTTITFKNSGGGVGITKLEVTYSGGSTPPATIPVESVALNKTTTSISVGAFETLTATVSPSNATNKAVTWSSNNTAVATVDSNGKVTGVSVGTANITVTTTDGGFTAQCAVTVTAAPSDPVLVTGITLNKSSETIKVGNTLTITATVSPSNATNQNLNWTSSNTSIATVSNGVVTGVAAGSATITASSTDGSNKSATCQVTVEENTTPVPQTDLALHQPGVYEERISAGGYGAPLSVVNGREYEVYYTGRYEEKVDDTTQKGITIQVNPPTDKQRGITKNESESSFEAKDGWFKGSGADKGTGFAASEEYQATTRCHQMTSSNTYELHIKGYDQFAIYAMDKKWTPNKMSDCKYFKVLVDNVEQTMTQSTSATIRRFNISTGEHVIKINVIGDGNLLGGFSLRVAQEPKVKYMKGNDSTQTVLATTAMNPVYYYVKYNRIQGAETKLVWEGDSASGITLTPRQSAAGAIGDTLVLGGSANCAAGTYRYRVVGSLNGVETSSVSGKFNVYNKITAMTVVDTINAYTNEEMDAVNFRYYTAEQDSWSCAFSPAQPNGITLSKKSDGVLVMQGTPTQKGEYDFRVWVTGDTVSGHLSIQELDMSNNPVLYLYKERNAFKHNGVYTYLKEEKNMNLIARVAKEDGLRQIDSRYKWILISEDVDADNAEVLAIARGDANLPVLNMKGFSYTEGRLDWGEPNNGTLDSVNDHRYKIFVQRADHPIFNGWNQGDSIQILNRIDRRGVMPIAVDLENTLCLATAYTRGKNYYEDGELQTILHEIPAAMRKGKKYLCLPIAQSSSQYLTEDGKKLISAAVNYLTNDQGTVALPKLEITDFAIGNEHAEINQMNNTISLELDAQTYPDLAKLRPAVKLAAPTFTFIATPVTDTVNFESSYFAPIEYIVSDYINRRVYEVTITHNQLQSIDNVYTDGEWVNVYDIYGRLIVTTNENIYTMSLPRGMYLIVTASGQTIKLMK